MSTHRDSQFSLNTDHAVAKDCSKMVSIIELDDFGSPLTSSEVDIDDAPLKDRAVINPLIDILSRVAESNILATSEKLEAMTRERLDELFSHLKFGSKTNDKKRVLFWRCNCEYTRRRIPPVFRNLPEKNDDDPDQIADLFAIDLQWLATRYPVPKRPKRGYENVWNPKYFHRFSDKISLEYPRRDMYWFCNGWDMSDTQQREMHILKRHGFAKELLRLQAEMPEAKNTLAANYYHIAKDPRHRAEDPQAAINRRVAIWFVGHLASWKGACSVRRLDSSA